MGIAESVASWLKSLGHDAIHLNDQALNQLEDLFILEKAIEEKRSLLQPIWILVSCWPSANIHRHLLFNSELQYLPRIIFARSLR